MNEEQILKRLKEGDEEALRQVMRQYFPYVRTIAANITIPPLREEDVEEVCADSFIALWNAAAVITPGHLRSYLAAIVRNTARNKLRSYRETLPLEEDVLTLTLPGAESELLAEELKGVVREAVAALPENEREIFLRYYFLYQKTADIAAELGMNHATVRTKLARGREKLKGFLQERGYDCELSAG